MMRRALVLLAAVGMLVAAGCGDDEPDVTVGSTQKSGDAPADLDGRTFVSTAVAGRELVAGSVVTISFETGRLTARAGCNTMSGAYAWGGEVLELPDDMMSTMMGCEPDLMAQDDWLSSFLTTGPSLSLDGDTLTLSSGDTSITLLDESVTNPARPLGGTAWNLETIVQGEAASSVPVGVETPTFQIGDDGFAAVFTGCNRGRTAVGLDADVLSFGPLALTKMACPGDAQQVETAVVAVLVDDVRFAIAGDQLTLTKGDQGLVYRAG